MPEYKLLYLDAKALGEPIRFLFLHGDIPFEDYRYSWTEWTTKLKAEAPFGQGPLLEVDGKRLWQSVAIQRYVAELAGVAGVTNIEKLRIEMIVESIWDVRCLLFNFFFDHEDNKARRQADVFEVQLPDMMKRLDKLVADNSGYFVDGKLTWPDLQYTAYYEYFNHMAGRDIEAGACENLKALRTKVSALPRIKEYIARRAQTDW